MISTRKSTRLTCNKDPLSNFISYHLIPFSTSRKLRRKNKPIDVKKYFSFQELLFQLSYPAKKKKKVAGSVSGAAKYGVKKALETATRKKLKKAYDATLCQMNQRSNHPSVIEESIKRAQNKDVSKPLRKSFDLSVTSFPLIMQLREALKRQTF